MRRGGQKVKPEKAPQAELSAVERLSSMSILSSKPTRASTERRASILTPSFLSRSLSEPIPSVSLPERPVRPTPSRHSSIMSIGEEEVLEAELNTFESLTIEEARSNASSSIYSRDSTSMYTADAASVYSSASSIYSSGASTCSFDDGGSEDYDRLMERTKEGISRASSMSLDSRSTRIGSLYQQRSRSEVLRRHEIQDAASRERSTLAKKAAMFKNSKLPPRLPSFSTSLPAWSMICRAASASEDCYDFRATTRRGTYTPAESSKDTKAMIIDEQLIDHSKLIVVAIRGSQFKSLSDWAVNRAGNPVKPVGFLDDVENACHEGFLQVAKAMVAQVATQLQQLPVSSERPSLLFTGHSAGGAVAAMLYSHMLSKIVQSELTVLASQFSSVNCITFGSPPLSLSSLPKHEHGNGVFLTFVNEGDPVTRLGNMAYMKSLAKLMTAPSSSTTADTPPQVKIVRASRGSAVIRHVVKLQPITPWEELPLWPTPPAPLANAGDVILMRDESGSATASRVTSDDFSDIIFGNLVEHTADMYIRRIKDLAFAAMMGRGVN